MRGRLALAVLAAAGLVSALTGCGASQVAQVADPVAKAATITESVPGYRMAMTMNISIGSLGSATANAAGVFDQSTRRGQMTLNESVAGHQLGVKMVFGGTTFYAQYSGVPGVSAISHGKPWLRIDLLRVLSSAGLGGLPVGSGDPRQFLDYLRAVGASATRLGSETVRGASTTHYRVTVDLDHYTRLVPASQRGAAQRSIAVLEATLRGHSLPMDVWIDSGKRVRRMRFHFPECVSGQHLDLHMTIDLFDYGPQAAVQLPPADETYDLTPLLASKISQVKPGC